MQFFSISAKAVASAFFLLLITACSNAAVHSPVGVTSRPASHVTTPFALLYVANFSANDVTIYRADKQNPSPIDTLTTGVAAPRSLFVDGAGTLYVSNAFRNNNPYSDSITEFASGSRTPTKMLTGLSFPGALTVDSQGTVYVQDETTIQVYENGSTSPTRSISGEGDGATAFAVDDHDNVYAVLYDFQGPNERCFTWVVKIPRGASRGFRIGVSANGCGDGIALDAAENLYVGYYGNDGTSHINVYRKNTHTPFRIITTGLDAPFQMAFGPQGSLYVPNDNRNDVNVYPAGGGTPKNSITVGISNPFSVAISPPAPY
jgi:hypothetical protein